MRSPRASSVLTRPVRCSVALACAVLLIPGNVALLAQEATPAPVSSTSTPKLLPPDQLDALVAPIALYPDALLAQTLAASTYPLEMVQLQQWLAKNPNLKDKALADAVAKEPWDPSVQSMAAFPDVVKRLADDIQWTNDLGNAFLAQQSDVMDAVQRMRKKAKDKGTLATNEQQKVETQVVEKKEVIVIESANPDVIYVPSYSPVVVYGPAVYPYPPIYYPYYPVGAAFVSFGIGVAMGAFWGGVWGGCGWGNNTININNNNNFNRVEHNRGDGNRGGSRGEGNRGGNRGDGGRGGGNRGGGGNWSHNPSHRGGAPYGDRATANKFGGNARGDSLSNRQASARQRSGQSGARASNRAGAGAGASNRAAGAGSRGGASGGSFNRSGSPDRVGGRDLGGGGSRGPSGLGGGSSGGFSGNRSRASSSRGASSFGSRGGGSRGGGGGRRR